MENIRETLSDYFNFMSLPSFDFTDVLEILILAFVIYQIIKWVRDTRAWSLVKGLLILLAFCLVAVILNLDVILFIIKNTFSVGVTALVILFQPELRKALEDLGRKNILPAIFTNNSRVPDRFSNETVDELVSASYDLARAKTGALIVIERNVKLDEYIRTGIPIDAIVSSALLINIFEHNTPLHDGAVVMRGDRIVAATCYLPLSDNMELSKELGTRHRAGVGVSEVTDSLTIIVSEETGKVSIAKDGRIIRNVDAERLRKELHDIQRKDSVDPETRSKWMQVKSHLSHGKK